MTYFRYVDDCFVLEKDEKKIGKLLSFEKNTFINKNYIRKIK